MSELNKMLEQLDNLKLTDVELHKKKLENAKKLLSAQTKYRDAPTNLLNSYLDLQITLENYKSKNPTVDLTLYETVLLSMRNAILFMEDVSGLVTQNEYLNNLLATQSAMLANVQSELNQYIGIENSILDNTLKEKITTVLKKLKI